MKVSAVLAAIVSCAVLGACSNADAPAERSDSGAFGTGAAGTGATGVDDNRSTDLDTNSTITTPAPGTELDTDSTLDSPTTTMPGNAGAGAGADMETGTGAGASSSSSSSSSDRSTGTTSGTEDGAASDRQLD